MDVSMEVTLPFEPPPIVYEPITLKDYVPLDPNDLFFKYCELAKTRRFIRWVTPENLDALKKRLCSTPSEKYFTKHAQARAIERLPGHGFHIVFSEFLIIEERSIHDARKRRSRDVCYKLVTKQGLLFLFDHTFNRVITTYKLLVDWDRFPLYLREQKKVEGWLSNPDPNQHTRACAFCLKFFDPRHEVEKRKRKLEREGKTFYPSSFCYDCRSMAEGKEVGVDEEEEGVVLE